MATIVVRENEEARAEVEKEEKARAAVLAQVTDLPRDQALAVLAQVLESLKGEIVSYVCEHCGSSNVEHAHWVNPNTDHVSCEYGTWNYDDTRFCNHCGDNYKLIDPEDFRKSLPRAMRKRYRDGVRLSDADLDKRGG